MSLYDVKTGKKIKDIYDIKTGKKLSKVYSFNQNSYKLVYSIDTPWKFTADSTVYGVAVDANGNVYAGTQEKSVYKLTPVGSNTDN